MTDTHGSRVKASILDTGLALWRVDPGSVTARRIGRVLKRTHSSVLYHFATAGALRDAIAAHAVEVCDPVVVPMLIAARHAATASLSESERTAYLANCS